MRRTVFATVAVLGILLLGYLLFLTHEIAQQSTKDEARAADVIIVLGAAEYRGKPSPVLKARLNHALMLYLRDLAPYIMTTGGAGGDPQFTEGEVGRDYLVNHGVPSEAILVEQNGSTTAQSLEAAAEIMRSKNLHSAVVVSDGYHIYRSKRLLEVHGVKVFGSPRPSQEGTDAQSQRWLYFRQAIGFFLWQIGVNI